MQRTMRVANYIVEVTPVTLQDPIAASPPLPPLPTREPSMTQAAPSQHTFPWLFLLLSVVLSAVGLALVSVAVHR